jgi:tetratricopeptide (TPR) repeat protein
MESVARGAASGAEARRPAILAQADGRDAPLYRSLAERGYHLIGFPARTAAVLAAQGVPIEPIDFQGGVEPEARQRGVAAGTALLPRIDAALEEPGFGTFAGIGDARRLDEVRGVLRRLIRGQVAAAAVAVEAFERLADRADLRLLFLRGEGAHPAKAVLLGCRRRGIPSLHLDHGVPSALVTDTDVHCDVVAVYGEWVKEWYEQCGNPPGKIAVTGNPAWDGYRAIVGFTEVPAVKTSLGLDPERPLVIYATTLRGGRHAADFLYWDWPWQHFEQALRALRRVHDRRPLQLAIKIHPLEERPAVFQKYMRMAREAGVPSILLTGHADPRHLLACDLLLCVDSTMAIEAMMLDRPVVSLRFGDLFSHFIYSRDDATVIADDPERLDQTIEALLFDPATQATAAARRPRSLYRFNYLDDGRAGDRVLQLVEQMIDPARATPWLARGAPAPLTATLDAEARASVARQHLEQARKQLEAGRLDDAAYLLGRSRAFLDNPGEERFLAGYVAYQRGDADGALRAFQEAASADPRNANTHAALASVLHERGEHVGAEAAAARALALDPDHLDALVTLAESLLASGRSAGAASHAARAAALAPDDPQVTDLMRRLRNG